MADASDLNPAFAVVALIGAAVIALAAGCGGQRSDAANDKGDSETVTVTIDGQEITRTYPTMKVQIGEHTFVMKLALDNATRAQGLGGMTKKQIGDGMLFVFPGAAHQSFWMKGCIEDVDIAFVSPAGRITAIHRMKAQPLDTPESQLRRYPSAFAALAALEFNAGTLDKLKLKPGDKVVLPLESLKQRAR